MYLMKRFLFVVAAAALTLAVPVSATPVVCGDITLGTRTVTVDPGLVGGLCYAQEGNLQNADIAALGLVIVDKDVVPSDPADGPLQYTLTTSSSGTWSFPQILWNTWSQLFLGFHFGGGGSTPDDNPDSFVVELAFPDFAGTFALGGGQLNGLSNIYLLGVRCTVEPCHPFLIVPEPGTLLLVALALGGLGLALRRRERYPHA